MPLKNLPIRVIIILTGAAALLIIGIALLCTYKTVKSFNQQERRNYTDCKNLQDLPCKGQKIQADDPCVCTIPFDIKEPLVGSVGLYYELETYSQTDSDYKTSKDDKQLAGNLSLIPAETCGNYSYLETPDGQKKPIAPCGAIADSMFADQFILLNHSNPVPCINTGLDGITEDDRKLYHNPPGDLREAFQNFSKPKHWLQNVWELDKNSSNNGFQNEAFIAWMKTDLKRKPVCRLNQTGEFEHGLPAGTYYVRVDYLHPFAAYSGPRTIIIASSTFVTYYNAANLVIGIICLIAALVLLGIAYVVKLRY